MRHLILLSLAAATLAAQPLSYGVKGGIPMTDFISAAQKGQSSLLNAVEHPQRYILGGTLEVRLPWSFAFEADILYRRLNYQTVPSTPTAIGASLVTSNDWEFPLMLKRRLAGKKFVRPFAGAGVAFDRLQGLASTASSIAGSSTGLKKSGVMGGVVGAGLDFHFLMLHVAPELRYTRWTSQHFNLASVMASQQNQAEFLVGITF